jgi:hypothetical protein
MYSSFPSELPEPSRRPCPIAQRHPIRQQHPRHPLHFSRSFQMLLTVPRWKKAPHVHLRVGGAFCELEPAVVKCVMVGIGLEALRRSTPGKGVAWKMIEGTCMGAGLANLQSTWFRSCSQRHPWTCIRRNDEGILHVMILAYPVEHFLCNTTTAQCIQR